MYHATVDIDQSSIATGSITSDVVKAGIAFRFAESLGLSDSNSLTEAEKTAVNAASSNYQMDAIGGDVTSASWEAWAKSLRNNPARLEAFSAMESIQVVIDNNVPEASESVKLALDEYFTVCPSTSIVTGDVQTCGGRGTCVLRTTHSISGVCDCDAGYYGNSCEFEGCPKGSNEQQCSGHGNCDQLSGTCLCWEDWTGKDCSCPADDSGLICAGHGTCNNGRCLCDENWKGAHCSQQCGLQTQAYPNVNFNVGGELIPADHCGPNMCGLNAAQAWCNSQFGTDSTATDYGISGVNTDTWREDTLSWPNGIGCYTSFFHHCNPMSFVTCDIPC